MAHLLGAENLSLAYPPLTLLDRVSLGVSDGDRIGVVGRNGDGKSTLLRLLARKATPDGGRVTYRGGLRLGMLDQQDDLDQDLSLRRAVVGDVPDHTWAAEPKVRDVIGGLLGDIDGDTPVSALSGGQRRRAALARVLAADLDVVLLDEPTNHLDLEGVTWLAAHIKRRWAAGQGALVVVTHDRWFLDEVCTATWEVHDGTVEPFEGGYAAYVLQRLERQRIAQSAEAKRQGLLRKELAWLRRGAPARTSKPKFRIEAANRLIENEPEPRNNAELTNLAVSRLGKVAFELIGAGKSYGPREVLAPTDWLIGPGDRIGILGANGAGKSTLLGLIKGALEPSVGRIKRSKSVRVASLTQDLAELDGLERDRVSDVISSQKTGYTATGRELTPGQLAERLGFTTAHLGVPVRELSGGQRRRLQFLLLLLAEPNVMVLDEPTNDLDTDMLAAVEDLLDSWPGVLLVVSHDRYLLERVTDMQYAVLDHAVRHLPGGVDEYLRLAAERGAPAGRGRGSDGGSGLDSSSTAPSSTGRAGATGTGPGATRTAGAGRDGAAEHLRTRQLASIERRLAKLSAAIEQLHGAMAAHDQTDFMGLQTLTDQERDLRAQADALEEEWLTLAT